jgi:hypothetical protein
MVEPQTVNRELIIMSRQFAEADTPADRQQGFDLRLHAGRH